MKRNKLAVTAAIAVLLIALAASVANSATLKGAGGKLEVFSWWTSGSENAALNQLFKATKRANPNIQIVNAAVAGGAGTNAKQVLATRLAGGDVPETWQTQPGGELSDFVKQGVVQPVDDLYAKNGWAKVMPKSILDSITFNGHRWAVLTGMH